MRGLTPHALEVFDFAEQGMVTGDRDTTTVAPQALYLLNDPFVAKQALALANRLLEAKDGTDAERIDVAYRVALSRAARPQEIERVQRYLADYAAELRKHGGGVPANVRVTAWASFTQALLGSAEFRYVK